MLDTWENDTMTYSPDMDAVFLNKFCIFLEIRQIRILKYFVKKIRQNERSSALLSKNVNKLSQIFLLFWFLENCVQNLLEHTVFEKYCTFQQ